MLTCFGINYKCELHIFKTVISERYLLYFTMSSERVFEYNDESQADRLTRKSKDSPFMIIGEYIKDQFQIQSRFYKIISTLTLSF